MEGSWVHLDPCEAAVDEPLIYQGWGKNQTYIFAFSATGIEDVTMNYTTKFEGTLSRRLEDGVDEKFLAESTQQAMKELLTSI